MTTTIRNTVSLFVVAFFLCSCSGSKQEAQSVDIRLFDAAQRGNIEDVRTLIKKGVNVNERNDLDETPLFGAVLSNSKDIVELLIKNGTDVNARDKNGITPFHAAGELVGEDNVKSMRAILLKHGAKE